MKVPLALLLCTLAAVGDVRADDARDARFFTARGRVLFESGDIEGALRMFLRAQRIAPNAANAYDVGVAAQRAGDALLAWTSYEHYLTLASANHPLRSDALSRQRDVARALHVVTVVGSPEGAEVFYERDDLGRVAHLPGRVALPPGEGILILRAPHHEPSRVLVNGTRGADSTLTVALEQHRGRVDFVGGMARARVRVRDEAGTETFIDGWQATLAVGTYDAMLVEGAQAGPPSRFVVARGEQLQVRLAMPYAGADHGRLVLRSTPQATVHIDGRPVAVTPVVLSGVTPGDHDIVLEARGFWTYRQRVAIPAGESVHLDAQLVRSTRTP